MFPISSKKCKIFFGIFALNFYEVWHFYFQTKTGIFVSCQKPQTAHTHEAHRKVADLRYKKKLPPSARWPFFFFFWGGKPKFWQKNFAPLIKNASRAAAFSYWVENFCTIFGIYAGGKKSVGTLMMLFNDVSKIQQKSDRNSVRAIAIVLF